MQPGISRDFAELHPVFHHIVHYESRWMRYEDYIGYLVTGRPERPMGILCDDAGQFDIGLHPRYWVHAERLVHKLDAFSKWQR
jgi:hypothetical protein